MERSVFFPGDVMTHRFAVGHLGSPPEVADALLVQDGPMVGTFGASLRRSASRSTGTTSAMPWAAASMSTARPVLTASPVPSAR